MSDPKQTRQFTINALAPSKWFKQVEGSSVWVAGYKMYKVPNTTIPAGPQFIDFDTVRAAFIYGSGLYLDTKAVDTQFSDDGIVILKGISQIESQLPEGAYLLLLAPFDVEGKQGDELAIRQRMSEVVGLLVAFEGRNIAFRHLFDNVHELGRPERSVISPTMVLPFNLPTPNLSQSRLESIVMIDRRISEQPETVSNRIRLSLRWFESATYDSDVDAFLKYWIALETLAMPNTTNIQPVNEALATAYNRSMQEVGEKYHIGRLSDLRNRIVHDGLITSISIPLLDYVAAVFVDVLSQIVGTPCEMKAHKMITEQGVNPLTIIPAT
jgi:hypothetical protein